MHYYIAIGSERKGPFDLDELRTVPLGRDTLVWSQGMTDWVPAGQIEELLPLLPVQDNVVSPPDILPTPAAAPTAASIAAAISTSSLVAEDFILLNPRLPRMAQAICIYVLVVNPLFWLLNNLSCLMTTDWNDEAPSANAALAVSFLSSIVALVATVLMFIGGLQLRSLKRIGVALLKAGLGLNIVTSALMFIALVAIGFTFAEQEPETADTSPATVLVTVFFLLLFFVMTAVEVVGLIWLIRRGKRLALN